MMKKLLLSKLLLSKLLLSNLSLAALLLSPTLLSTTVHAHSGHSLNESVHSFLHVEHIIAILAIGLIAYTVSVFRNK